MKQIFFLASLLMACILLLGGCVVSSEQLGKKDDTAAASYNLQLGINYLRQGDLSEAKAKIDRALEQDPKSPDAHFVAGMLYDRINEKSKADSMYSAAISLAPRNSEYVNGYAAFLCLNGKRERGEKLFLKAADDPLYKTPAVALLNAGSCALDDGRANKAEEYFRRALKLQPNFTAALLQMADLELKAENFLSARAFLERYQQNAATDAVSLWLGVRIERGLGNLNAAQNYARRLKQEFSTSDETKALLTLERNNKS